MNLQNILTDIEEFDGEVYERIEHVSRRHMFSMGKKALATAAPLVFGSALNKAYAQAPAQSMVVSVLNLALTLEYLEAEFYNVGLATPGLIPVGIGRTVYDQIAKHENAHVTLLRGALGSAAVAKPRFDLTAGGAFPDVLSNYQTYLAVSQALEDTGVRAYKGQAPNLVGSASVLQIALQIHSVEARHAARVRLLRGAKGWITGMESTGLPGAIYAGEQATREREVNVPAISGVSEASVSAAFDEPLNRDQILAIAGPFIIG